MNSKQKFIIALLTLVALVLVGFVIFKPNNTLNPNRTNTESEIEVLDDNKEETNYSTTPTTITISPARPPIFANDVIRIQLVPGWHPQNIGKLPGAVNITKKHYILYINPNFNQGSGVNGARFSEIAMGAPGVKLVVKMHPSDGCKTNDHPELHEQDFVSSNGWYQFNEYTASFGNADVCNLPTDGRTHWYFSYFIKNTTEGYVTYKNKNYPEKGSIVVTLTIDVSDINNLPVKNSTELKQIFSEVRDMLDSLEIK